MLLNDLQQVANKLVLQVVNHCLFQGIMSAWNHGADPSDYLLINDRVQLFKVQHD